MVIGQSHPQAALEAATRRASSTAHQDLSAGGGIEHPLIH